MYDRTIQMRKQNRHKTTANCGRLSGIELPWTLREGLSLDITLILGVRITTLNSTGQSVKYCR